MATWSEIESAVPDLAARARALFDAHRHKTIATLRKDGSPRISGIEVDISDGELWLGSMLGAVKGADLRRDPRFALHSTSDDPVDGNESAWPGDAKLAGLAVLVPDGGGESDRFRADITELVVVRVGDPADHLVIESWHADGGYRRRQRY